MKKPKAHSSPSLLTDYAFYDRAIDGLDRTEQFLEGLRLGLHTSASALGVACDTRAIYAITRALADVSAGKSAIGQAVRDLGR